MDHNNIYLQEALKKCHIYHWTWDNVESIMKMRFPTLNNMNYEDSDQVTIDKLLEIIYSEDITKLQFITGNETGKLRDEISLDIRLKHPDGKFMWYEFIGNTVYNEKGDIRKIGGGALCNNKRIRNHKSDYKITES